MSARKFVVALGIAAGLLAIDVPVVVAATPSATPSATSAASGSTPSAIQKPSVVLDWSTLGLSSSLIFSAANQVQSIAIPVPQGLTPIAITGTIDAPQRFSGGYVEFDSASGDLLGSVTPPSGTQIQTQKPFSVALTTANVQNNLLDVGLVVRLPSQSDSATACDQIGSLNLRNLKIAFTGTPAAPRSISQFFPGVLRSVTFDVDPKPTLAEQQTVLAFVAGLVQHYRPVPVTIKMAPLARTAQIPDVPVSPLDRTVIIRQNGVAGIRVAADGSGKSSVLLVGGSATTLPIQATLFANNLSSIAQTSSATVTKAVAPLSSVADTYTLDQLGITAQGTVLGQGDLYFGLDQGLIGGPLQSLTIDLIASYTPLSSQTYGTVTAQVNGTSVFSAQLGSSGKINSKIKVPVELLTRNIGVTLNISYQLQTTCSPITAGVDFTVDPRSAITVQREQTAAGGFRSLPTAFDPGFQVWLQNDDVQTLAYAAYSVAGMQGLTSLLLNPTVVDTAEVQNSHVGALIVCGSTGISRLGLQPPISGRGASVGVSSSLAAQIPEGLGSIQVFADTKRNRTVLLVTTTGSWSLVDPLFAVLNQTQPVDSTAPTWATLNGDVLFAGLGGQPTPLTVLTNGQPVFTPPGSGSTRFWIELGVVAVFGVVGYQVLVLFRRRRSKRGSST